MKCCRFDLHRKYVAYIEGLLPAFSARKVEDHIRDCPNCDQLLERLRGAVEFVSKLPAIDPPENLWPAIQKRLRFGRPNSSSSLWVKAAVALAFGMICGILGSFTFHWFSDHRFSLSAIGAEEFTRVPIDLVSSTTEPHIVTEGYVSEVRVESDEGDKVFKLVENLHNPNPFVICEVIDPLNLPMPSVGSFVRVYGVSRYDNKSNHEWHELHPVLDIEILKK
jgi:anti-sigma factor RsiW